MFFLQALITNNQIFSISAMSESDTMASIRLRTVTSGRTLCVV